MARKPKFSTLNRARKRPVDSSGQRGRSGEDFAHAGEVLQRDEARKRCQRACRRRRCSRPRAAPAMPPAKCDSSTAAGTLLMIWLAAGGSRAGRCSPIQGAKKPCARLGHARQVAREHEEAGERERAGPSPPCGQARAGPARRARRLRRRRRRRIGHDAEYGQQSEGDKRSVDCQAPSARAASARRDCAYRLGHSCRSTDRTATRCRRRCRRSTARRAVP